MSILLEVAQLSVAVVVVDVGEHLHDLGLFLFQTSDIQHKYSKFRDFQVIDTYRDIECILKIFWTSFDISISVKQSYLEFRISKRGILYQDGNIKKLYTTFIQNTCPDSIVRLLKNRIQPKLFPDSKLHRNFTLKQRYLTNKIRYEGDSRVIGNILKSSYSHKNFIIFGQVDFNWH